MTDKSDIDLMAGEYALGTLEDAERARFEELLGRDGEARSALAAWEERLATAAAAKEGPQPSPAVWQAIQAQIAKEPRPGVVTVRADEGRWRKMAPGIDIKLLNFDEESRVRSALIRVQPGAVYPGHRHDGPEECLMISGDLAFGSLQLKAGDYHLAPKGMYHETARSEGGCLLFIRSYVA